MDKFLPSYYFDLSSFQHQILFADCLQVWLILTKIDPYLKKYSLGKIEAKIPEGVYLVNRELISIGKDTVIEPGAYIRGPCIIGEKCSIRHGAYIRGDLITGNRCVIGHDTEVKNAIFLDGAQAPHFAYVGDTILGNRVNLGAGTVCANLRIDHKPIVLHIDGQRIETGLRKFGAIVGDDCQTGCNSVINPGSLLGKMVSCYPGTNFGGFVAPGQIIRSKAANFRD